jgi:hypothetical protein
MTTWMPLAAVVICVIYLCVIILGVIRAVIDNIRRKRNDKKEDDKV